MSEAGKRVGHSPLRRTGQYGGNSRPPTRLHAISREPDPTDLSHTDAIVVWTRMPEMADTIVRAVNRDPLFEECLKALEHTNTILERISKVPSGSAAAGWRKALAGETLELNASILQRAREGKS